MLLPWNESKYERLEDAVKNVHPSVIETCRIISQFPENDDTSALFLVRESLRCLDAILRADRDMDMVKKALQSQR